MKIKDFSYLYRIKSKLFNKILIFTLYPNSGIIKINNVDADNILSEHDLNIPLNYLYDFAKAFCFGANIQMTSVE